MLDLAITAAHASTGAPAGQQSLLMNLLIPVAFFAIFYFLIIRPQSKRNKQHKAMVDGLAVGNEVVFAGGLIGRIKKVEGDYAVITLNHSTDVKIQRASVVMVLPTGTIDNI
ncbi:preprotein translocase subunit YajC [Moraxella catarrhalis]|uniref:preprotein translocase subunit YajC n=1 Tax=Moraxella catarrhalis TaxID=480 RepID=UPI0007E36F87|nr:preprotein translocase subunit YajC [Moraxella catarrhalis]MPW74576.1 preprotein translocase subunit YajC [Moraxella catarrhalis]OAV06047.1 Preprotein translocase subunit YajC [Moraxella catarrhalis]OAV11953.1 Preprotein translocase subunit YajC [Moraxella catarrhalis]OAV18426.1 Preprotein translocase subunit YajC [Moraxella catarrhalis]OAV22962.1 Preprotein translocase subunit YajC [Moraxella catarrhalis]